MREIKFRAWDKNDKGMWFFNIWEAHEFRDFAETFMQYTGLKDKNGKEIYEGDIVQLAGYNNYQKKWLPTYRCAVKFTLEHGGYSVSTPYTDNHFNDFEAKYCEVIGNIYENLELLEKENIHSA